MWEYHFVQVDLNGPLSENAGAWGKLGEQGWELVTIFQVPTHGVAILYAVFKRQKLYPIG